MRRARRPALIWINTTVAESVQACGMETLLIAILAAACAAVVFRAMRGDAAQILADHFRRRQISRADYDELRRLIGPDDAS